MDDEAPVSRGDLGKGRQELVGDGKAHINWSVLVIASAVILAFSVWAIFMPDGARTTMRLVVH
ncbi:hypothetical protein [Lysobacter sp. H21R4]|uniref:hypothetical protein n=1 Tax=Lysobacter sp. H21R4 TaxID=2781021 RepID=UPI001E2FF02B|nr:hypothetical protein [Lysobacter sp. H21R4]